MVPGQVFGLDSDALVPVWLSTNGKFYAGLPGGQIISMKEGQAVVDNADRAASMFRQANGIQHFVAALRSPRKSGLAITDKPVVHVIYDGTNDPD